MGGKIGRAAGLVIILAACGHPKTATGVDPTATPVYPPQPLDKVFVLESWGAAPEDTVVRFAAGQARTVIVRRGAPDNSLFARLTFPPGTIVPPAGDSVAIRLVMRPGLFGMDLVTDAEVRPGAEITFSYAIHFVAPRAARDVYGTDIRFERFLGVGRLPGPSDSLVIFLDSWRSASDLLTAPIAGPGRYLVAAPRTRPGFRTISF